MKRFSFTRILLAVALFPLLSLAADGAPAAPGIGDFLVGLLTPANIGGAVVGILSLLGGFSFMSEKRKRIVALAAQHAFLIVEDIANETEHTGIDKAAEYMKQLDAVLVAKGWRPLKPNEAPAAQLLAKSMHGAELAKAKVLAKANELAGEALGSLPQ